MLFFELLQVAIGNRDRLSHMPSADEWSDLYDESERQAVTGVLLQGINRLKSIDANLNLNFNLDKLLLLQWIGVGQMIKQQNRLLDERCVELLGMLEENGLHGTILKGQGVALLYDKELRPLRHSGDIDVYVDCGFKKAMSTVQGIKGLTVEGWDYKHAHLRIWDDTEVEMHYHVEVLLNLWKNRKLQKWFAKHQEAMFCNLNLNNNLNLNDNDNLKGMVTPTVEFNVFYILLHIYRHFLYEGVGIRQIVDYYFVLRQFKEFNGLIVQDGSLRSKSQNNYNPNDSYAVEAVKEFGMERFAKGLMWVMQEALGMPREWMLWEPDEREGRYILDEVLAGGNFGHHDSRLTHGGGKWNTVKQVCRHNWHLMRHYPADVVWAPVWFVWHKCWKLKTNTLMTLR